MRVLAVYSLAGLVLACSAQESWVNNIVSGIGSFFETTEEAPYALVRSYDSGYEERLYPARKWVCTEQTRGSGEESANSSFMTLFRYISGANEQNQRISMTKPVSRQKTPTATSGTFNDRMCFYIGEEHQQNVPTPTGEGVFIEDRPEITIFTRRIGGWPNEEDWANERTQLTAELATDGNSVRQNDEYMSVFQAPMQFWSRRNELWLIKN